MEGPDWGATCLVDQFVAVDCSKWVETQMETLFNNFRQTEANRLTNHVFLPRKLPHSQIRGVTIADESKLLSLTAEIVRNFQKNFRLEIVPPSTPRLFNLWETLQQDEEYLSENNIQNAIQSLQEGDMFALYIRQQNCGMILTMPKEGENQRGFLSTFTASQPNEVVTLSPKDLLVPFPSQTIDIPLSELLVSLTFGRQLAELHFTDFDLAMAMAKKAGTKLSNRRDVARIILVSEWIAATLADKESRVCSEEFPKILKKIRDEVLLKKVKEEDCLYPFRRSGFWMTIKVVLHLNLTHEMGLHDGVFLYKLILLELMSTMCRFHLSPKYGLLDIDLSLQMIAKVARRLEKLRVYSKDVTNSGLIKVYRKIRVKVSETVLKVRAKMNSKYEELLAIDRREAQLQSLQDLDFKNDIHQTIPKVKAYISVRSAPKPRSGNKSFAVSSEKLRCCSENFPDLSILDSNDEILLGIGLGEVENWIFQNLNSETFPITKIRDLAFKYSEKATGYYKDDPVGYSRMILTFLLIIKEMDSTALEKHTILKEHKSGVKAKVITNLLLPKGADLKVASELEDYFTLRNTAVFPSLIEEEKVTSNSFSARYASSNYEMCRKRDEILASTAQKVREKEAEVAILRERVATLREELNGLPSCSCDYVTRINRYGKTYQFKVKCYPCKREPQLLKAINEVHVNVYEKPLKDEVFEQNAVVFELLIPIEIACLRDILYIFSKEICLFSHSNVYTSANWYESVQLRHLYRGEPKRTFLGSSNSSFTRSHFNTEQVERPMDIIIRRNAYDCIYYGKTKSANCNLKTDSKAGSIKKFCTFQIEMHSPYRHLQLAVDSTTHSQNISIASQNSCPKSISLTEWVEFGSLRAGNRLQMRNIFRVIENGRLSFKNESVLILILQALWEGGQKSFKNSWHRDSSKDFVDDHQFCEQMNDTLWTFLQAQRNNWKQPYNLLTVIMIAIRILELNSETSIHDLFSKLLLECRRVAVEWFTSIENAMMSSNNDYPVGEKLRSTIVNVGICCALTFCIDPTLPCFSKILNSDFKIWIMAIVKIDNNLILSTNIGTTNQAKNTRIVRSYAFDSDEYDIWGLTGNPNNSSFVRRNFLRMIRNQGMKIGGTLKEIIRNENYKSLNVFASDYFAANHGEKDIWQNEGTVLYKRVKDKDDILRLIQVDLVLGKFLVDTLPVSRLPKEFTSNKVYERIFGTTVFEVAPSETDSFCTINNFRGCKYRFRAVRDTVIITEERPNGDSYELVPHTYFIGEVPHLLVENYCHWWCAKGKIIEFKPLPFDLAEDESTANNNYHYIISLETNKENLREVSSEKFVVDVRSNAFRQISKYLNPFELANYILVLTDSGGKATVELSRMRLKFHVTEEGGKLYLDSNEYEGMRVGCHHKIEGCFTGLRNSLVLQEIDGSKKFCLIPHGEVRTENEYEVNISLEVLRKPNFFIYEVNEQLRQLQAGKSYPAWFFLVYLHAITAQPLEDHFTGVTGTERALEILQTPHCWSDRPFDDESLKTMMAIARLAPVREFYHGGRITTMKTVNWPTSLTSMAAHDLYSVIIVKLIADSRRLKFLFTLSKENSKNVHTQKLSFTSIEDNDLAKDIKLLPQNLKAYNRYVCYNPNASLADGFLGTSTEPGTPNNLLSPSKSLVKPNIEIIRKLSALRHERKYSIPLNSNEILTDLLVQGSQLKGVNNDSQILHAFNWVQLDLKDSFLNLYNICRRLDCCESKCEWLFFLCGLGFSGKKLDVLLLLQGIAENPLAFQNLSPPNVVVYQNPEEYLFNFKSVQSIFRRCCAVSQNDYLTSKGCTNVSISRYKLSADKDELIKQMLLIEEYNAELEKESEELTGIIYKSWPSDNCNSLELPQNLVNVHQAKQSINILLRKWYQNLLLKNFLQKVSNKLSEISVHNTSIDLIAWSGDLTAEKVGKKIITLQVGFSENVFRSFSQQSEIVNEARSIFETGTVSCPFTFEKDSGPREVSLETLYQRKKHFLLQSKKVWKFMETLCKPADVAHLVASGLYPRIVPLRMLSQLISKGIETTEEGGEMVLKNLIGACGVIWSYEQQATRMIKFLRKIDNYENFMRREMEVVGEEINWSPKEYPEWLLFELEMNLKIRPIQIEVAKRMIDPPGGGHSVMQLNMGEGKTAVIVPLLCLTLGDTKSLCRIIVLKPLFQTNLAALRFCLGGILNRRLYTFPCRRDMGIGTEEATKILSVYQECRRKKGIVMTLPEYILSFQLKMYEKAQKNDTATAAELMKTHKWLMSNSRDILDESDEILHAKYQLVYTVGNKVKPAGESLRWIVAQGILKLIPAKLEMLLEIHGVEYIEFDAKFSKSFGKEVFTPCRLLRENIYRELTNALAEDFLNGNTSVKFPELKPSDRNIIKIFLTQRKMEEGTHEKLLTIFAQNFTQSQQDTILILAGYLKYEILRVALFKRWRVNYGVNPTGRLRMAVPFKAKDVAAEMTEFGHPDVAICLTQLSYYYSGLNDRQIIECFDILEQMPNGNKHYENWINKVEPNKVDPSVQNYEGLPLDDAKKCDLFLFPILRRNMYVIDFWLAKKVFPDEARQFQRKMMATPWDLCSENKKRIVTGFSGTNDSKELLPGPICQNDLAKLKKTNENIRKMLLQKENEGYYPLPPNVTGKEILEELVKRSIPVLVDSGALMLELSNEKVAEKWLEEIQIAQKKICEDEKKLQPDKCIPNKIDAAVYFNENDVLVVRDLQNRVTDLESSPYRDQLGRCVIYLDDCHTRGTDLKFPVETKACITLGSGTTRDKTVQACMRMRMLGNGHSIAFWASQEAHNSIRDVCGHPEQIENSHVMTWIESNSKNFVKDGLVHWAAAGYNYAQKRAVHSLFSECLRELGVFCSNKELLELKKMYGGVKKEEFFTKIMDAQFNDLYRQVMSLCKLENAKKSHRMNAVVMTRNTRNVILLRLEKHIPEVKRFAELLDEEQEKELQEEKERNTEISVEIGRKIPCESKLDENVKTFIRGKKLTEQFWKESVLELPQVLVKYFQDLKTSSWGMHGFATKDFISVIKRSHLSLSFGYGNTKIPEANKIENYIGFDPQFFRPVVWIANVPFNHKRVLLLLSPFEANEYFPLFREENAVSTLHMYSPRLKRQQNSLINNAKLQVHHSNLERMHVDNLLLAQLSFFSGSLYFANMEEQVEYSQFVGIIPRPRTDQHQQDFENDLITESGFVLPLYRKIVSREMYEKCKFDSNPEKLIRNIADSRHGFFPRSSHVSMLVVESKDMSYENNQQE